MRLLRSTEAHGMLVALALALTLAAPAHAAPLLKRSPGSWFYGPQAMWTIIGAGPASVLTFFPMSEGIPTAGLLSARISYQMIQNSGDCKMRPAVRFSGDGVDWGTEKETTATYVTTSTPSYGEGYVDLVTLTDTPMRAYIQFGMQTLNQSGTAPALCNGILRVEPNKN